MYDTFTATRENYIKEKIKLGVLQLELLRTQDKLIKEEMRIQYRLLQSNMNRIGYMEEINKLYMEQLFDFSSDRENRIHELVKICEDEPCDIKDIVETILKLRKKGVILMNQINEINSQIPDNLIIIQKQ